MHAPSYGVRNAWIPILRGLILALMRAPATTLQRKVTLDLTGFNNVRFEWNQCTDGGLFKIYIWEDDEGLPGDDIFSELQLTDN